jgi:hypothetical protein
VLKAQVQIDTLAIQGFELPPGPMNWPFTAPSLVYNTSGTSSPTAAPPNSPIGIGGSYAWETTTNSGGMVVEFNSMTIPAGYDSVRVHFNLAAMNLNGSSGGPDHLDYVLVEVSFNGGAYYNRMRIRGATSNNSFWPYSATGVAQLYYQPATEITFQPTTSGLQNAFGYSNCEIVFPGSVTQVQVRITARSSSSSDTWLIDNVVLTAEKLCSNSTASVTEMACDSFVAPSGAVFHASGLYMDTIPNATGCDSIIDINLTIIELNNDVVAAGAVLNAVQTGAMYQWLDCDNGMMPIAGASAKQFTATSNGNYAVVVTQSDCRDTSECVAVVNIGVEGKQAKQLFVYPNPVKDELTVELTEVRSRVDLKLYDVHGRLVFSQRIGGQQKIQVEMSSLPKGLYLLEVRSDDMELRRKLVKE